jgi:glucosamine--fructose-6-phosphate aminotransferase (isomerizing)
MCGIVGYVGVKKAAPILLAGLEKLEYRGYDSAGICVYENGSVIIKKAKGRLSVLSERINFGADFDSTIGIGHTRWATHGAPSDKNSHPHSSSDNLFTVVHNGIIENYIPLKEMLISKGYIFKSETDSEVIAHLLSDNYSGNPIKAIKKTLKMITGSYALGIIYKNAPDTIFAVRKESPLLVGITEDGNFIASDIPAILEYTRKIYFLENNELVVLKRDSVEIFDNDLNPIQKDIFEVDWSVEAAEKGGYEHFMLKEIFEQPEAINKTISPRIVDGKIKLEGLDYTKEELEKFKKIYIVACGSAYHVGMVGKYIIEKLCRISVEVDFASEFRYRDPILDENTLFLTISQSGETADTLAALREAKRKGAKTLSIVNVVSSSIARDSEKVIYTWAGPEIAVATTKAYSAQLSVIYLIAFYFAELLGRLSDEEMANEINSLEKIPYCITKILEDMKIFEDYGKKFKDSKDVFFLGRGTDFAVGLEGSLKLKEISYIHSEAYAAGELKHGTISLIEEGTLVVALATQEELIEKTISNIKEVKARGAKVLLITTEGNTDAMQTADFVYFIPKTSAITASSLLVVPLQAIAYYISKERGCDVDKPRNLAKSVTVE